MMIEIDLSQTSIDKIVALGKLTNKNPKEVSDLISGIVDKGLDNLGETISQVLSGRGLDLPSTMTTIPEYPNKQAFDNRMQPFSLPTEVEYNKDTTGISDGLGDIDVEDIIGETHPEALVPKVTSSVPSDEDLANELEVQEPDVEAAAEATFGDSLDDVTTHLPREAEQVFGDLLGTPVPGDGKTPDYYGDPMPADDPRSLKKTARKKRGKGKVTPLIGDPSL